MSLQIIKAGILDSIQDLGRYGFQHVGINPGGAMDKYAAQSANALLGNDLTSPVIEIHFPSSEILFKKQTIICLTGADFSAYINNLPLPLAQPVVVNKKTLLKFKKKISGARCYLAVLHQPDLVKWLNSYSTNMLACSGGFKGRAFKRNDTINFMNHPEIHYLKGDQPFKILSWKATTSCNFFKTIRFLKGNEWDWLAKESKEIFESARFKITGNSNRMGYRLEGDKIDIKDQQQLISSPVTFGTVQLLPEGQLIILMADHQTTGGYPRIAHVISADLPLLAQADAGDIINFKEVDQVLAEHLFLEQQRDLQQIQTASKFKMEALHAMRY